MLTKGEPTSHPYVYNADPTHVRCHSPIWHMQNGQEYEQVILDVSANGYDYAGHFDFMFTNNLEVYRIQPLCGPNEGGTPVNLIGTGFHASEDVKVKWGVVATEIMP